MSQHIYTYDPTLEELNEIGEAGHVIKNASGTSMEKRKSLQFDGCDVTDDSTNNKTIVSPRLCGLSVVNGEVCQTYETE